MHPPAHRGALEGGGVTVAILGCGPEQVYPREHAPLAEQIAALAPMDDAKVFFTTSGTEANEAALLLACTARRSNQILALRNSYQGRSFAAMATTGHDGRTASTPSPCTVFRWMGTTG